MKTLLAVRLRASSSDVVGKRRDLFANLLEAAVKFGGSVGTMTGSVWPCWAAWAAWSFAATYIQWLNAWSVIGLPATVATELLGSELPQPAMAAAITKKAA